MKVGDKVEVVIGKTDRWLAEREGISTLFAGTVVKIFDQAVRVEGSSVLRALPANEAGAIPCRMCDRPLTDEASKSIGYGPDCALHLGVTNKFIKDLKTALRRDEVQDIERVIKKTITFPLSRCRIIPAGTSVIDESKLRLQLEQKKRLNTKTVAADMRHEEVSDEPFALALPFGYEPRPYQWRAARFGLGRKRWFLWDTPGTGKTISAIIWLMQVDRILRSEGKRGPFFVVCPPVMSLTWKRTLEEWWQGIRVQVLRGYTAKVDKKANIYVLPYSILASGWHQKTDSHGRPVFKESVNKDGQVIRKTVPDTSKPILTNTVRDLLTQFPIAGIVDESHYVKGASQRTLGLAQLVLPVEYLVMMTGTAVLNKPSELTTQLDILGMLEHFGGADAFEVEYAGKHLEDTPRPGGFKKTWTYSAPSKSTLIKLHDAVKPFTMRRKTGDVLKDMPPLELARINIELANRAEYEKLEREIDELPPMQKLGKIAQLRQVLGIGKIPAAIEWTENFLECDEKLVVFAYHRSVQRSLIDHFEKWNPATILGQSEGGTQAKNQVAIDRFQQDPNCLLVICSMGAAREGITLTAASNMLMIELEWVPALLEQAWKRIHRIGQVADRVSIWSLLGQDSFDDTLSEKLLTKRLITGEILDRKGEVLNEQAITAAVLKDLARRVARRRKIKKEVA